MKQFLILCFAWCASTYAIASNTITLSSVSGTPQTEVEVVVSLDNADDIVALELNIPLGEHLSYVNNSAVLAAARNNGHQISAAQVGQELRIYVYSFSQNALRGDTGELLTFRLLLGNEPDDYELTPTIVLSNVQGTSIESSTQTGTVTIQAPKLQIVNPQIDYGHIPIRATYTKNLQLKNVGNLPLVIEDITTTDPLLMPQQTALTIEAGQTASVSIEYAPVVRGAISKEVIVQSNAINGEQIATIVADPFSVNELHVGSTSGIADSIVTISLTMNNMEPIVAMQCAFKLPKQLEYVANSLAVNATRSNGHQTLSTLRSDTLFLAIFSMTNQPLHANDGEVATFQLRLNDSSGTYYLKPIDVVLSNITEENMVSATLQGSVRINAPSISSNASLSFGNVSITEVAHATYSVRNNGSAPLVLERATFLAEGYSIVEELPITIANSKSTTITVAYQPTEEGDFSTTMNLYTNDPNNRLKTVALSGHVYEPNVLSLSGHSNQDGTYTLSVALDNYTDIVAVQYDLHWRSDMTTSQAAFIPTARLQNHNAVVKPLDEDSYRVIIYSMSNASIAGHNGKLHQLVFTPQGEVDYIGSIISIDNVILSDSKGRDKTAVNSTTLRTEQTIWTSESAIACDSYNWHDNFYTESGIYYFQTKANNGCDSIVTLHLTILPDATTESEELALCPSELPYEWYGQSITEEGTYFATEQYAGMECDSVIHELTLNVYVQTLPTAVTLPVVRMGEAIDVTIPTAEIQVHIDSETWYAPNAELAWYIMENSDWVTLTAESVKAGTTQVALKYVVTTDCGSVESEKMLIAVEKTYFTVIFLDWDGTELHSEQVEQGKSATAPADPTREGYLFKGWDKDFTNVQSDLNVKALYEYKENTALQCAETETAPQPRKVMIDNKLYILMPDGTMYDTWGRKMN